MRHAQQTFLEIAQGKKDWIIIDCTKDGALMSEQMIADKVWYAVQDIL